MGEGKIIGVDFGQSRPAASRLKGTAVKAPVSEIDTRFDSTSIAPQEIMGNKVSRWQYETIIEFGKLLWEIRQLTQSLEPNNTREQSLKELRDNEEQFRDIMAPQEIEWAEVMLKDGYFDDPPLNTPNNTLTK
jgi:predicted DNA binding protein